MKNKKRTIYSNLAWIWWYDAGELVAISRKSISSIVHDKKAKKKEAEGNYLRLDNGHIYFFTAAEMARIISMTNIGE